MTIKASELEAMKKKERQKALDAVLPLLLGLPVKVLKRSMAGERKSVCRILQTLYWKYMKSSVGTSRAWKT
jgi:hypothetical protein